MRRSARRNLTSMTTMNFALILFLLTLVTGVLWRSPTASSSRKRRAPDAPEPSWVEYPKSFFPVLLIVFLLRSFVAEPFKIPSSSMRPTLEVGDFILVNKFTYGIRLPIIEKKIIPTRRSEARRRRGVPLSASIRRRTSSSAWSASAATSSSTGTSSSRSTASRWPQKCATAPTATSRACASRRSSGCIETASDGDTARAAHDRRQSAGAAGLSAERPAVSRAARIATTMSAALPARCPPATTS